MLSRTAQTLHVRQTYQSINKNKKMLIDKEGEQVEVFTQEELSQKLNEKIEEYKSNNPGDEEFKKLQEQLKEKEEDIKKLKDKDTNFSKLRGEKEKLEEQKKELEQQIDQKIKGVEDKRIQEKVEEKINSFAQGDEELAKKIKFHYGRIGDVATNDKEINQKLVDAFILATKRDSVDVIDGAISSRGAPVISRKGITKISPELKQVGEKMGITEEDFKKYGKQ